MFTFLSDGYAQLRETFSILAFCPFSLSQIFTDSPIPSTFMPSKSLSCETMKWICVFPI